MLTEHCRAQVEAKQSIQKITWPSKKVAKRVLEDRIALISCRLPCFAIEHTVVLGLAKRKLVMLRKRNRKYGIRSLGNPGSQESFKLFCWKIVYSSVFFVGNGNCINYNMWVILVRKRAWWGT